MNNKTLTHEELQAIFLLQVNANVINLITNSSNLSLLLINPNIPLDNFRSKSFYDDASYLYELAKELGDHLPFSNLVVYITAFADILEKRLKE
jgi:hypothetical protein